MAKISVIVPVYKVEPYLRKCVDSILNQTFRDFELILVDDGSPDNCGKICDEYATADGRVKVIHQQNGGLSAARNSGIDWAFANSNSQYVTFIDSDDWVDVDYIERLLEGIKLGADVSCTSFARVYKSGDVDRGFPDRGWMIVTPEEYWVRVDGAKDISVAKLYSKKLFSGIRFPVGKINEDMFTTYRVIFSANNIACRDIPTYKYLKRDDSITTSAEYVHNLAVVEGLEAQYEYFSKNCYSHAADYASGRVLAWKLYTSELIKSFDQRRSGELRKQVEISLRGRRYSFWRNRDVFRQTNRCKFVLLWPFAMMWNAIVCRKDSWLIREALPMFKRLLLERLNG